MPSRKENNTLKILSELLNKPSVINLRSNRKIFGIIRFIDRHFNVIMSDVVEIRQSSKRQNNESETKISERKIPNLILRGDSVITISTLYKKDSFKSEQSKSQNIQESMK